MTKLSAFIRQNTDVILLDWEAFARSLPSHGALDLTTLRDHAREMLDRIADELEMSPSERQREEAPARADAGTRTAAPAQKHGAGRAQHGFSVGQMVSEFRALRATVIRLWTEQNAGGTGSGVDEMIRFNAAIDHAIAESVTRYTHDINRSRDRFIAILGHDLRTPLHSILTSASFVLETVDLPAADRKRIDAIANAARRMDQMVADILDFARVNFGGQLRIVRRPMDVGKMIADVVSEVKASLPESEVRVESSGGLHGTWDCDRLTQAVTNIVENAVQHGSRDAPVRIVARGAAEEVTIAVVNQGPVIPEDRLNRLVHARGPAEGDGAGGGHEHLGLGLQIAEGIVRTHGGTLEASSSADEGTAFTIHLPRGGQTDDDGGQPQTAERGAGRNRTGE